MPFPLLAKDLTERAARRRTYVLRGVCGLALAGWFWWSLRLGSSESENLTTAGFALMGSGQEIFATLAKALCWALLLIQPALMAPVLTHEKERGTLTLLLLTPQRPWKLLFEKYLSGLIPMATLLLFALPLDAVAYAYGGVSPTNLLHAGVILAGTWLQTGAVALLCSSWFRTTPAALIASYLLLAGFYFGTTWINNHRIEQGLRKTIQGQIDPHQPTRVHTLTGSHSPDGTEGYDHDIRSTFPPTALRTLLSENSLLVETPPFYRGPNGYGAPSLTPRGSWFTDYSFFSVLYFAYVARWMLIPTVIFLILARLVFIRRADPPPSRHLPRFFHWLDAAFNRANRWVGNVAFATDRQMLLANDPILWRESATGMLGRPQHIVRIGFAITVIMVLAMVYQFRTGKAEAALFVPKAVTFLGALFVVVRSVEAFAGERTRQSMDVLLCTPIPRGEIVRHKARPIHWLSLAFTVPAILCFAGSVYLVGRAGQDMTSYREFTTDGKIFETWTSTVIATTACLSLLIAFWQFRWLGIWMGMRINGRTKATIVALCVIAAWVLIPLGGQKFLLASDGGQERSFVWALRMVQPGGLLGYVESSTVSAPWFLFRQTEPSPMPVLASIGGLLFIHALIALALRALCICRAERYLHRQQSSS